MGDFVVDPPALRNRLGIEVDTRGTDELRTGMAAVDAAAVAAELEADRQRFDAQVSAEVHARSVRSGLALRALLDRGGYLGFSANFMGFQDPGGAVMPFLEISKGMARGVGYAGEGDVLTAGLVGALARAFGDTTFTEIFCSDWEGNRLFLSHMGEINPELAAARPRLVERSYPFIKSGSCAVVVCAVRPGPAVFVNVAPGPGDRLTMLVSAVTMQEDPPNPALEDTVRGWMKPACDVTEFLETYSRHGGTHHSALVMGQTPESLCAVARFAGIEAVRI
jgi:L-arabinose isomerase